MKRTKILFSTIFFLTVFLFACEGENVDLTVEEEIEIEQSEPVELDIDGYFEVSYAFSFVNDLVDDLHQREGWRLMEEDLYNCALRGFFQNWNADYEQAELVTDDDQDWLIIDYLDNIDVPDGLYIADSFRIFGNAFDYVIYDLQPISEDVTGFQMGIVVKRDDMVLETIIHEIMGASMLTPSRAREVEILELDANFNGLTDIAIFHTTTEQGDNRHYSLYLYQEDGFVYESTFSGIANPRLDVENQVVLGTARIGRLSPISSRGIYRFMDDGFVRVEQLEVMWDESRDGCSWRHEVYFNGEWQLQVMYLSQAYTSCEGFYHHDEYWRDYWFGGRWGRNLYQSDTYVHRQYFSIRGVDANFSELTLVDRQGERYELGLYSADRIWVSQRTDDVLEVAVITGSPSRYVHFFDVISGEQSPNYFNPIVFGELYVGHMEDGVLILMDAFGSGLLYEEVERDFSPSANGMSAIRGIEMLDDETILIEYLGGDDFEERSVRVSVDRH